MGAEGRSPLVGWRMRKPRFVPNDFFNGIRSIEVYWSPYHPTCTVATQFIKRFMEGNFDGIIKVSELNTPCLWSLIVQRCLSLILMMVLEMDMNFAELFLKGSQHMSLKKC